MPMGGWVKRMIAGVVATTAACAVMLFLGCSTGRLPDKSCDDGIDRSFAILTALLTTVMSLGVKLETLDEGPAPVMPKRTIKPTPRRAASED